MVLKGRDECEAAGRVGEGLVRKTCSGISLVKPLISSCRLLKIYKLLTHMIYKVLYWGIVSHCSLFSAIMCWGWGS